DPCTFRPLPWAPNTGWMMCDIYFADGSPVPFSTRRLLQKSLARLAEHGYDYICGLEVEFALFRLEDSKLATIDAGQPGTPPDVNLLSQGYQYLTDERMDQIDPALEVMRRQLLELGLPLRSVEVEF